MGGAMMMGAEPLGPHTPRVGAWMQRVSSRPAFATDVAEMNAFIAKARGAAA